MALVPYPSAVVAGDTDSRSGRAAARREVRSTLWVPAGDVVGVGGALRRDPTGAAAAEKAVVESAGANATGGPVAARRKRATRATRIAAAAARATTPGSWPSGAAGAGGGDGGDGGVASTRLSESVGTPSSPPSSLISAGEKASEPACPPIEPRADAPGKGTAAWAPTARGRVGGGAAARAPVAVAVLAEGSRRRPSPGRAAATVAPTANAVGAASVFDPAADPGLGVARATIFGAGAVASAADTGARLCGGGPPAGAGPVRAADPQRGGAGGAAAPDGTANSPRAAPRGGKAEQPRVDASGADRDGGTPAAPFPVAPALPDSASVLSVVADAVAACPVLAAGILLDSVVLLLSVFFLATLSSLCARCFGSAGAGDGTTHDDATDAVRGTTSIASAVVMPSAAAAA